LGFSAESPTHMEDISLGQVQIADLCFNRLSMRQLTSSVIGSAAYSAANMVAHDPRQVVQTHLLHHSAVGLRAIKLHVCLQISCRRWMACARNKLWWMTPEWGSSVRTLPTETQFLLLEHGKRGPYSILLPLIDGKCRATLKANRNKCALNRTLIYCHVVCSCSQAGRLTCYRHQQT
jgi:hypothetical protein